MALIFVYGTLKRGYRLNDVLRDCELVKPDAVLNRQLRMVDNGAFPYLLPAIKGEPSYYPTGEVYKVDDEKLMAELDRIEGAYDRTKATTKCGLEVEFYLAKGRPGPARSYVNRYVQIDKPEPGMVTWGKMPWVGGEVVIHGEYQEPGNELLLKTGDEEQRLSDELPTGMTDAQKLTASAISSGNFEIKIGLDGVATITVTPSDDDREYVFGEADSDNDGEGPQDTQDGD